MVNLLILLLASRLTKARLKWGRFAAAAALGGAYACVAMVFGGAAASLPIKAVCAFAMCFIAYWARGEKRFLIAACAFWAVSFVLAGAVYACMVSFGEPALIGGAIVVRSPVRYILAGLFLGAVVMAILAQIRRRLQERENNCVQISLRLGERRLKLKAFVDTGNFAKDPLTGYGVIFLSRAAAAALLDADLLGLVLGGAAQRTERLRIIPYATAAGQGIFYGIEIDEAALDGAARGARAVVCVARRALPGCSALVGSSTLDELKKGAKNEDALVTETGGMGDASARIGGGGALHQRQRSTAAAADTSGGRDTAAAAGSR